MAPGRIGKLAFTCSWAFFFAFAPILTSLGADDEPAEKAKPLVLFDGKSLDGWKKTETFKAGEVKVEDESIVLVAGGPMAGIVSTRKDLPTIDYDLTFEAKRTTGDDFFAAATFPVGKSFITLVNGGWGGSVTGLSSLNGSDAAENETRKYVKYQNNTWYKFKVRVTGEVIRCWIDDKETFGVNYQDVKVSTRIEVRVCQPLGFASWRTGGAIRNVEIRKLTPEEVEANNKAVER